VRQPVPPQVVADLLPCPSAQSERAVMAFASDEEGEVWLGVLVRMRGSARNSFYQVEWYELAGGTYSLWDDNLDLVQCERLLVRDVSLEAAPEGDECFVIAA
jgi:hypothetical protein